MNPYFDPYKGSQVIGANFHLAGMQTFCFIRGREYDA